MILLSDLSSFNRKSKENFTSLLITITLCDYCNKRCAHHTIIFYRNNKVFGCNFWIKLLKNKRSSAPETNYKIMISNQLSVIRFFNFKDHIPNVLKGCAVNEFSCGNCSFTLACGTSHHCTTCFAELIKISIRTGKIWSNPPYSSIRDRGLQESHIFSSSCLFLSICQNLGLVIFRKVY